jgi:hypothetical protein
MYGNRGRNSALPGKIRETSMSKFGENYEKAKAERHDVMTFKKLWAYLFPASSFVNWLRALSRTTGNTIKI